MRIGPKRIGGLTQIAVAVSVCLAFMAMTTGLLLVIHLHESEHGANHDSQNCSLCQQFLTQSKKLWLHAGDEFLTDPAFCRANQPLPALPVRNHHHPTSRSRAPPHRS